MDVTFRFDLFTSVITPDKQNGMVIGNLIDQTNTNLCVVRLDKGDVYWSENVLLERVY